MHKVAMRCVGLVLALPMTAGPRSGRPLVAVELEVVTNTLDSCDTCGCRAVDGLEPGKERKWWVSFGIVRRDSDRGWEALGSPAHCGSGSFDDSSGDFRRTVGTPYVILDLTATPAVRATGRIDLHTVLDRRKLTGFDAAGRATYARVNQSRVLPYDSTGRELVLPLFMPDSRESEAFGIHEVLLRVSAAPLGLGPAAAYGAIAVTADVPGADILLDGTPVHERIVEDRPTTIGVVRTGEREIRVRDYSDREARAGVRVEEGKTVQVRLTLRPPGPPVGAVGLVPLGMNPQGHEEYWRLKDRATVVRIPAGEFLMGSLETEGEPDERPQHRVQLSEFLIDKAEVTWRQFLRFSRETGRPQVPPPVWGTADDLPATNLIWDDARAYCEWVGGRLPTEAEWEKAARGTDGRRYPWGDEWDPTRCNTISGGPHRPEPVGSFRTCSSPYGVLDMSGSMWEWCADWHAPTYYSESPARDPQGPPEGTARVLRGGYWMNQPTWVRSAHRFKVAPWSRGASYGFRCAHDAPK